MLSPRSRQIFLASCCLFLACGAALSIASVLRTPSDPQSAVLFGLSAFRLLLVLALGLPLILAAAFLVQAIRDSAWAVHAWETLFGRPQTNILLLVISVVVLILGWIGLFLPPYRVAEYGPVLSRLQPAFFLLLLTGTLTLFLALVDRMESHRARLLQVLAAQRSTLKSAALFGLAIAILWLGIAWSGVGIRTNEDYSYGAGVPLLASQVLVTLAAVGAMLWGGWFQRNTFQNGWIPFVLIWLVSAAVWAWTPLRQNYFMPGPYLPNEEFYPHSDAVLFDLASQYALIGQGLHNGVFMDRALYMAVLFYLHNLAGQNYELLLALQAALFAVLPALVYLLGKSLHGPAVGMAAAVFTLLRGVNAIALNTYIDTASPKMILTDFPTAIGLAALVLFLVEWLRRPGEKWQYLLWLGGTLGLTIMLRTNALILLPFIFIFVAFRAGWPRWKKWMPGCALIVLAMVTTTLPWDLRNHSRGAPMFDLYFFRIRDVLRFRYPALFSNEPSLFFPKGNSIETAEIAGSVHRSSLHLREISRHGPSLDAQDCHASIVCSVVSNYLHNFVTSVMVLPVSPMLDEARYAVKERAPYWQLTWTGDLTPAAGMLLAVNLAIVALGLARAWRGHRLAGLTPAMIFLAYNLSNGLARTSGGRYIVPTDWIVVLYFAIGAVQLLEWLGILLGVRAASTFTGTETNEDGSPVHPMLALRQGVFVLAALLAIGSTLPLTEVFYPPRYQLTDAQTLASLQDQGLLQQAGIESGSLNGFLEDPQAKFLTGRVLYPRFYKGGRGDSDFPYQSRPYPRTIFTLIGPAGQNFVMLPKDGLLYFPNAADVVVLGCVDEAHQSSGSIDALAVFLTQDGETYTYLRSPAAPLHCPLPEPTCDNNNTCY